MAEQPPIPRTSTAIIFNDMINGNLRTKSNAEQNALIEKSGLIQNSVRLVAGARERQIPIIWIRVERRADYA
ncbi:MAG TPA: hypothetical protein VMC02_13135, partial [Steroidobacteraceae bacterium]|nr:hypothetical protein [Steroidobacteraceae bacterium]